MTRPLPRPLSLALAACAALALAACDPNPFCLDHCGPPDAGGTGDGGGSDGGRDMARLPDFANLPDLHPTDAAPVDGGCTPAQLQSDPHNCGACGHECVYPYAAGLCVAGVCKMGPCQPGHYNLNGDGKGCEYECVPMKQGELCANIDYLCNGQKNQGYDLTKDPKNCGTCKNICAYPNAAGACSGGVCGLGACQPGYKDLDKKLENGCEYKCPVFPPKPETCNGIDDDCDGVIDNNPIDVGKPCDDQCPKPAACVASKSCAFPLSTCAGTCCGICTEGTTICASGQKVCQMGKGPKLEVCNGVDDNCDGQIDEGFDLKTDPLDCGACGHVCSIPNAVAGCAAGQCVIATCKPGYADLNKDPSDGCEYTCPVNPPTQETCNGKDDDCDGIVDNHLVAPPNFCNQQSICAGSKPVCMGVKGFRCNYAQVNPHIEVDGDGNLAITEKLCDGWDGNCNTQIDESFPLKNQPCFAGTGACRGSATFVCTQDMTGTVCPAKANPMAARDELCNGVDDNCDGQVDERVPVQGSVCYNGGAHACLGWRDAMVKVDNTWVYQYEAAHPDATSAAVGTLATRACSNAGVLPWAPASWDAAGAACAAVKDSTGAPMRLCSAPEWSTACAAGIPDDPVYAYADNQTTYQPTTCNSVDAMKGSPWPAGSGPSCYANQPGGAIYDMSGNVTEWTSTPVTANGVTYYKVRGGAFDSQSVGTSCRFDFTIQVPTYQSSDLGFRCCSDHAP